MEVWFAEPGSIGLEITESALIRDLDKTVEVLSELKRLGFPLAIDDFGTGYSSFAYLRRFPIDELKIDRVFVDNMTESLQDKQIVQSIIDLAHNFGLPVVAEGVERLETLQALAAMECEQIQGYYFAKPMPAQELLVWYADFHRNADTPPG
jgi:EAL domain-containing protein (putative c-di-GMP-specific phosphodiesterase class I)